MDLESHDRVVQRPFAPQTPLSCGPESPFASRAAGTLAWIGPVETSHGAIEVSFVTCVVHAPVP